MLQYHWLYYNKVYICNAWCSSVRWVKGICRGAQRGSAPKDAGTPKAVSSCRRSRTGAVVLKASNSNALETPNAATCRGSNAGRSRRAVILTGQKYLLQTWRWSAWSRLTASHCLSVVLERSEGGWTLWGGMNTLRGDEERLGSAAHYVAAICDAPDLKHSHRLHISTHGERKE